METVAPPEDPLVNPKLVEAEYAVRGRLLRQSEAITAEIAKDAKAYPFTEIIACNIGNPQAMLQKPMTFYRQVAALVDCPWMIEDAARSELLPKDAIARAQEMLKSIGHFNKTGAYTNSQGYPWIRRNLAAAMQRRDGVPANPDLIFLTDGASVGIKVLLQMLIHSAADGVMIPIPQYPLYTATITILGGQAVPYYLDEANQWGLDIEGMKAAYDKAVAAGTTVRAITVINPGNPTGNVMSKEEVRAVCQFAEERSLVVLADEVYQENIYCAERKFVSFKSVMAREFPALPLVSFHSVSKGVIGECGRRGGYMEVCNLSELAMDTLVKMASISLCPNVAGQIMVDLMMNPPVEGDVSHASWKAEYNGLLDGLKARAEMMHAGINEMKGIETNKIAGAMYAFPSLTLPPLFCKEAEEHGMPADEHWCMELLKATGVLLVPGSGFHQKEGTHHFRITILPPKEKLEKVCVIFFVLLSSTNREPTPAHRC